MSVPYEDNQKSNTASHTDKTTWNRIRSWIAIALAIVAVILALTLRGCSSVPAGPSAGSQCSVTPTPGPSGIAGLSAYELWLKVGNKGTEQDFLKSLVGTPGKDGYVGSNGFTGASGPAGATGARGTAGESAYQIWLDAGHTGTPQQFLDSLAGSSGTDGIAGLSAYQLWLALGHTGTESQFLASLVGPQGAIGPSGAPGVCTVGDTGATGAPGANGVNGLSAYEVWLANGNTGGTVDQFLTSLIGAAGAQGPQGPQGETGAQGATGPAGPAGLSGLGYSASYWSTDPQAQTTANTIQAMTLNQTDWQNGITRESNSHIKIGHAGKYNIAFSAQLHQTNSSGVVNIWLAKNGVAMPDTNTKLAVTANNPYFVAAWNFFVDASQNDYYELMWSSTDNHTVIEYEAPVTTPAGVHPAVPSLILTVNQVG